MRGFLFYAVLAAVLVAFFSVAVTVSSGSISDCIDATCRIRAGDGSTGTGCVFDRSNGHYYAITCAHVTSGAQSVTCEFWSAGHQSTLLPGTVVAANPQIDTAIVAIAEAVFAGRPPRVIPLAPRGFVVAPGQLLTSVGCSNGTWSTAWKGHALGYDGADLRFLPTPANGRSGSAVFDGEGRQIVGVVRARTENQGGDGIATSVQSIYRVFDSPSAWPARPGKLVQCGPNGCGPNGGQGLGFGFNFGRQRQPQQQPQPYSGTPYPTLPLPAAPAPSVDLSPLGAKLDRIADMLTEIRQERQAIPPSPATPPAPSLSPVDEQARAMASGAIDALKKLGEDVKAAETKLADGLMATTKLAKDTDEFAKGMRDTLKEHGDFLTRRALTKEEVQEKLGDTASKAKVEIETLKTMFHERIGDTQSKIWLAFGAIAVVAVIVVVLDMKHKRDTGDPLIIEKLAGHLKEATLAATGHPGLAAASAVAGGVSDLLAKRLDALDARLHDMAIKTPAPGQGATNPTINVGAGA